MKWFLKCFKHYVDFRGRARRKEYWFFYLFLVIFYVVFAILDMALFFNVEDFAGIAPEDIPTVMPEYLIFGVWPKFMILTGIFYWATLLPMWAVSVRRLHDTGHSEWWLWGYLLLSLAVSIIQKITSSILLSTLLSLVLLGFSILFLVWMFTDSDYEENAWGPCPKLDEPQEVLE